MSRRAFLLWLPLSDAIVAGLKRSVASTTINSTDLPCCTNALRWINKVLRESMNKRFFLRTVYPLFFPAGGGQKRCPTMWPKWMWPKSSAFIFGITPKWEDGRHTRFIFTPHLWHLRRTYNCPGNTQTEDGQGLGMSHQDSKGWWRKYSNLHILPLICSPSASWLTMTCDGISGFCAFSQLKSHCGFGLVEGVPRSGML